MAEVRLYRVVGMVSALLLALAGCTDDGSGGSGGGTAAGGSSANAPAVTISAPANGDELGRTSSVDLAGSATDASGQAVPPADLEWTSSIDGSLGTGDALTLPSLTPGIHRIELEATDGSGRTGTASVRVVVSGAGGPHSRNLAEHLLWLPQTVLGTPLGIPPAFHRLSLANPTDVNAATGAGAMAAGLSSSGAITVLKWPSPSYHDQVNFLSRPGRRPGFGSLENMGVFAGATVEIAGQRHVAWFRDPTWETTQTYLDDEADVVVTEHVSEATGLRVTETAFVMPDRDVLGLRIEAESLPGGPDRTTLLLHENLAPCTRKFPYLPVADSVLDMQNDFAAAYHQGDDAIVHFRPEQADAATRDAFASSAAASSRPDVAAWVDGVDATFGPGSYLALGSVEPADEVHVGEDAAGNGPAAATGPSDPYADAADGALGGNPFSAGRSAAVVARDLDLSGGPDEATFYLAAGPTLDGPDGARTDLAWARARPFSDHLSRSLADWRAWTGRANLPNTSDPDVLRVCRRGLVTLRTATDRRTGAIVASIATQLPYGEDWPRDGAFLNRALDVAGYTEMATRHNEFYAAVQRRGFFLPGTYEMNYYADGTPGGPIGFEIDNAALAVWTMADHVSAISDPAERSRYLGVVYPAIRRGAGFLTAWRDPRNGLQLPANEDDHPQLTQGLQGAATIVLALDSAIDAGQRVGESRSVLDGWRTRRDELKDAIFREFWDASAGRLDDGSGLAVGAGAWSIWPCPVLDPADPRTDSQASFLWGELQRTFSGSKPRSGYDTKLTLALAEHWANDPARMSDLRDLVLQRLIREVPTEGTDHYAEFYEISVGPGGALAFRNLNDVPHVWAHALVYLTAMRLW